MAALDQKSLRLARTSLTPFIEHITPHEPPAAHHRLLAEKLEAVERGEILRLMVFEPPGSAKSKYCSWMFPAWFLGRNPKKNVIISSYSADLAKKFGKRTRNTVGSPEYAEIFDTRLSEDTAAKGDWETRDGGEFYACGVDGAVTGRRGDLGIGDDWIKGRKEADSETIRENTWDWYMTEFLPRLKPGAAQIIVMTRWHEDDPPGRILPEDWSGESGWIESPKLKDENGNPQKWYVLCLPAEARENDPVGRKVGEILWPEYLGPVLRIAKGSQSQRDWSALYQQVPSPDEGTFFKREWFKWYRERPQEISIYGASDYAVTDSGGDFTEHGVFGVDPGDDLYVLDWWYGQTTPNIWIESLLDLVHEHRPFTWFSEGGVIQKAVEPFLDKRMRERQEYCRMEWIASIHDKSTRARAFQARASMGKVYLPDNEIGRRLLDQLLRFPAGKYDDAVDVCSLIGRVIDEMHPAVVSRAEPAEKMDVWDKAFAEQEQSGENWRTA